MARRGRPHGRLTERQSTAASAPPPAQEVRDRDTRGLRRALATSGIAGALRSPLKWMRTAFRSVIVIRRFRFFETDLTEPVRTLTARVPLEIRPATLEDVEKFGDAFEAGGVDEREARKRFDQGHVCIVGLCGGQLAHFQWIALSATWIPEIGINIVPRPGEAYGYDAVTLAPWRGYGIHPAVSSFSDRHKRSHGCTRHFSYVRVDNRGSLKNREILRRRRTTTIWSVRIAWMKKPLILVRGCADAPAPRFRLDDA